MSTSRSIAASTTVALLALALGALTGCDGAPSSAPLSGVDLRMPASGDFGMVVCSTAPLHDCTATVPLRRETRLYPTVDIAAASSCPTHEADARSRCPGAPTDAETLRCLAGYGVFIDMLATTTPADPAGPPAQFILRCHEGVASIDVIEPF